MHVEKWRDPGVPSSPDGYGLRMVTVSRSRSVATTTTALPAAASHMVTAKPYFSAKPPASVGAMVAPMTSPTSVAMPIEVARNCGGTLSVGTNTRTRLANWAG